MRRVGKHFAASTIHEQVPPAGAWLRKPWWRDLQGIAKDKRQAARQQQHAVLRRGQVKGVEAVGFVIDKAVEVPSDVVVSTYGSAHNHKTSTRHFELVRDGRIRWQVDTRRE